MKKYIKLWIVKTWEHEFGIRPMSTFYFSTKEIAQAFADDYNKYGQGSPGQYFTAESPEKHFVLETKKLELNDDWKSQKED